jgi:Protein of unknown function (DUF3892)
MGAHEITCINKPHHLSQHEHITHIGNWAEGWRITLASAVSRINSGQDSFYTVDQQTGKQVPIYVVPATGLRGAFLQTYADGKWKDNLLAQQECGANCRIID